ncbi:GH1 family beta-glucosidase [Paraburkholderia sp. CNPSo 3272]|uniref:GH1 family beta-glucosidase n=1 Tax=Paraburkholderia sp. CNPSo 3272 TaxID=2940931 RepID=UPI0020B6F750|nr:GH1 family beta-glucosidase [Paraburkholderia sp. CNPSo 3272]MCP3726085.1 GH1 family beta-glucosidase [Paraburkholderia sp. CNPSo 3272]
MPTFQFKENFVWGVATSSYQIEGAAREDGRGESIWDTFCRVPGKVVKGESGDVACDHYHRLEEDLDLMAQMGVNAYRFSIAWPRVQPDGRGAYNEKGLAFYERLVDGLLERGIQPFATLYHWDLPQALQTQQNGWESRDTAYRFADYARKIGSVLGDRVASIATHNEPWCTAWLGNATGYFAPGNADLKKAAHVAHHLLLSHGLAVQAMRADGVKAPLGIVLNQSPAHGATEAPEDIAAASLEYAKFVRWYMDPIFKGEYPAEALQWYGANGPQEVIREGDFGIIGTPLDFLGINYYTRIFASASGNQRPPGVHGFTDMDWEVYPEGLTELLTNLNAEYRLPPIFITENGCASKDVLENGRVQDTDRIRFLDLHLAALSEAARQGVDVAGYFAWSMLDNFEWACGYDKRFGMVYVDYETQKRTLKDSAHWYSEVIAEHAAEEAAR